VIDTLYVESALVDHPRSRLILQRFPKARVIECERYSEVFNPKSQNFRLQKQRPALILAQKHQHFALPAPQGYHIGAQHNYYFSHLLNCLYDCRYCFLQGMYQSANYVWFINYEDYQQAIAEICATHSNEAVHFFSGYDCDSLALEPITHFAAQFLPFFAQLPNAWLELRTKSTQIRGLLAQPPLPRCVVAFSLSPETVADKVEAKAPPLARRIEAVLKLQQQGWLVGLRFDPLIYQADYKQQYQALFAQVFEKLDLNYLHSVSLGVFRLPQAYFKKIHKLYPEEKLFASPLTQQHGVVSYQAEIEAEMMAYCRELLLRYIPKELFFPCQL